MVSDGKCLIISLLMVYVGPLCAIVLEKLKKLKKLKKLISTCRVQNINRPL